MTTLPQAAPITRAELAVKVLHLRYPLMLPRMGAQGRHVVKGELDGEVQAFTVEDPTKDIAAAIELMEGTGHGWALYRLTTGVYSSNIGGIGIDHADKCVSICLTFLCAKNYPEGLDYVVTD